MSIVCITCTCPTDPDAEQAAALIATGLSVWDACRAVWGA